MSIKEPKNASNVNDLKHFSSNALKEGAGLQQSTMRELHGMLELQVINARTGNMVKAFALGDTDELIVGRDEGCDICINASSVSREHCSIEHVGQDILLRDLQSSGGTSLQEEQVSEIRIEDGMEFKVGPAILRFIHSGL